MKLKNYIEAVLKQPLNKYSKPTDPNAHPGPPWMSAKELAPILRVMYPSSVHARALMLVSYKLAEVMNDYKNSYYKLAPKFKTWAAAEKHMRDNLVRDPIPAGYAPITDIARKIKRTGRCVQYFAAKYKIPHIVLKLDKNTRCYHVAKLLALWRAKKEI